MFGRTVQLQIANLDIGILYIFAIGSLGVYGIVLAGWGANSKFPLLGGLRSSAQMFSYELGLGLSWVGVIMLAGSFRMQDIVDKQAGWFWNWNLGAQFVAFLVYFVAATAEVSRTPFDLPEGEAELVAGFHTEYSSMKFALIQMAEYINMITVAVLCTNMFLGGWHSASRSCPSALGMPLPAPVFRRQGGAAALHLHLAARHAAALPLRPADGLRLEGADPGGDVERAGHRGVS